MPTIELAIYCKDEEACVERAIRSVIDHVDGFYAWDTGSTDSTVDILRRYTNRIYRLRVPEEVMDFGEVETMLIHLARGDFVLRLDADEVVTNPQRIRELVESDYDVWRFPRRRWADLGMTIQTETTAYPDYQYRLVRADGHSRWVGILHPEFRSPHPVGTADDVTIEHFVDVFHTGDPARAEKRRKLYTHLAAQAGKAPEGSLDAMRLAGWP